MAAWSFRLVGTEIKAPTQEALAELQDILRAACAAVAPPRQLAPRYAACRSVLLDSELRAALPGFLTQCVSLQRFCDFIQLLSPNTAHRLAFVERSFDGCRPPAPAPLPPRELPPRAAPLAPPAGRIRDIFGDS